MTKDLTPEQLITHRKNEAKMQELMFAQAVKEQVPRHLLNQSSPADQIIAKGALDEARELYFRYAPMSKIASVTGIHIETIRAFVYSADGWKKERDSLQKELKEEVRVEVTKRLAKIEGKAMTLLEKGMDSFEKMIDQGIPMGSKDLDSVAGALLKVNKVKIEEIGDGKDGTRVAMTPQEMLQAIAADPYLRKSISVQEVIEVVDSNSEDTNQNS
jgi:hypothetical protein